jgi:hypothetical protein
MQDSDGEQQCARNEKAPEAISEASEDVCEPCKKAGQSDNPSHVISPVKVRLYGYT